MVAWVIISLVVGYAIVSLTKTGPTSEIEKLGGRIHRSRPKLATRLDDRGWGEIGNLVAFVFRSYSPVVQVGLGSKDVIDDHLVHLSGLTELEWLNLSNNPVTDEGLVHLKNLKHLKWIMLQGTQVTNEGREELKRAIPGLQIN